MRAHTTKPRRKDSRQGLRAPTAVGEWCKGRGSAPGLRQVLVLYPYVIEGGFSVVSKSPETGLYDAHFGLAQIGKQLLAGYKRLGGPAAFGSALSEAEVQQLADAYSEARDRLHPHSGVKLGS